MNSERPRQPRRDRPGARNKKKPIDDAAWARALRDVRRRDRAELERAQQAWLASRLRQAEAVLEAMGLPADCWRALHVSLDPDADSPFPDVLVGIQSGPTRRHYDGRTEVGEWPGRELYEFAAAAPASAEAWEAMRLASMASVLDLGHRRGSRWSDFSRVPSCVPPEVRRQIMGRALARAGGMAVQQYLRGAEKEKPGENAWPRNNVGEILIDAARNVQVGGHAPSLALPDHCYQHGASWNDAQRGCRHSSFRHERLGRPNDAVVDPPGGERQSERCSAWCESSSPLTALSTGR